MPKYSTDRNQKEIVEELKQLGFSIENFARTGRGFPDLLIAKDGLTIAVEIKTTTGKFKIGQLEWLAKWKGHCGYATSTDEVLKMFKYPTIHCLTPVEKRMILNFVERWKLEIKSGEVSQTHIKKLLEG